MEPVAIDEQACTRCGICYEVFGCPAIGRRADGVAFINYDLCNGNGSCIQVCPEQAIIRRKKEQEVPAR
jgi:indolepyruvate ferredoxin oxidoreductase alpha subunit